MRCTSCGGENPDSTTFCGWCGSRLGAPPIADTRVAPHIAPSPSSPIPQDELRLVSVLFADLAGFTTLAESMDAETVGRILDECFDCLVPCVEHHGGTVDKFIGDALMALFGAPVAHDNDPELAVLAALEMQTALSQYGQERGLEIGLHIGINTGRVLAASVGGGGRRDYSVIGDAVNVAARLQQTSNPGEILIGGDTLRLCGHCFQTEAVGAIAVKGRAGRVNAHRVLGRSRARVSARGWQGAPIESSMVGREQERRAFEQGLAQLEAGSGGVVAVVGEAGMGKSRLVAEARDSHVGRGAAWLEGQCIPYARSISYQPFKGLLRQDCAIGLDDSPMVGRAKLSQRLEVLLADDSREALPYLSFLLQLPSQPETEGEVLNLPEASLRMQLVLSTRRYLEQLAADRPTVLVFEDVHWMDESSMSLLEQLLQVSTEARVLFCLVSRPDADSPFPRLADRARAVAPDRFVQINLARLPGAEVGALIENLVGSGMPRQLHEIIESKADGNPFFVEEIIRSLIDMGALEPDEQGSGWRATTSAPHTVLPDTLESLIVARVDRLPEELRRTLKLASVVGRVFPLRLLAGLGPHPELGLRLEILQNLGFVQQQRPGDEAEYAFIHAYVQEATYGCILARERKEMHRRVAESLERWYGDRLSEVYGHLAYHYARAEVWDKASDFLAKAGDQAQRIAADNEALAHFELALEAQRAAVQQGQIAALDRLQRAQLWRKVGSVRAKQHHVAECMVALEEAEAELERGRDDTTAWWHEWIEVQLQKAWGSYFGRSHELTQQLADLEPTVRAQGTPAQQARLLDVVIAARMWQSRYLVDAQTLEYARMNYSVEDASAGDRAKYCFTLGFCLLFADQAVEGETVLTDSLRVAAANGDITQQLTTLTYLTYAARARGNVDEVAALSQQCLSLSRALEIIMYEGAARANLSWVFRSRGESAAAGEQALEALKLLEYPTPYFLTRLARWPLIGILSEQGNTESAIYHARALLGPSEQPLPGEIEGTLLEAVRLWEDGDPAKAAATLLEAHALADTMGYG